MALCSHHPDTTVSSTTPDQPPKVEYQPKTTNHSPQEQDVPEIEEDKDYQDHIDDRYIITHHNTHQENKRIRQKYTERLQDLSDQQ